MARPVVVLAMHPALVRDMVQPEHLDRLRRVADVPDPELLSDLASDRASDLLGRAELLLTGWGCPPIDEPVLARAPRLAGIFHAAGSVKGHCSEACWDRGIAVSSAAAANALPVAEYALAAILFAAKGVFRLRRSYAERRCGALWDRELPAIGSLGRRVGIVGASRIGRQVIEWLRSFDLELLLYDPFVKEREARELGARAFDLDGLLAASDVVSLHAPLLDSTRGMIGRDQLARMRDGTTLVNTARGGLVDPEALEHELVSGRIEAVLDVTEPEVLPADSPLYELPNVFLTPHVAGALGSETRRLLDLAIDELERFVRGTPLRHAVHREDLSRIA